MDQQLQKAIADLLNGSIAALKQGAVFLQEQLPDLIRQLLIWKAVQSAIGFSVFLGLTIVGLVIIKKLVTKIQNHTPKGMWDDAFNLCAGCAVTGVLTLGSFAICMSHLEWLQIIIAPKVYLIEYAARVLK